MRMLPNPFKSDPASTVHPMSRLLSQKPEGPMRSPARALGLFSIGLGIAELVVPGAVARAAGVPGRSRALVRLHGLREIGVGIGLLNSKDPTPWLWGRVAGDVLDLATVGSGLFGQTPVRTLAALATLGGVMAIDSKVADAAGRGPRVAVRDYSTRSGFPKPADEMRGAARDAPK